MIIGGGVHGLATAYYLAANHGIRNIAVLDRGYLGGGGSGRNTAILRSNYLTPEGVRFYDRSLELYRHLAAELNFNVMFSRRGHLTLAHNDSSLRTMRWRAEVNKLSRVDSEVIDTAEVARLVPALDASSAGAYPILGALYPPTPSAPRRPGGRRNAGGPGWPPCRPGALGAAPDRPASAPTEIPELPLDAHPELFRGRTHGIVDFSEDVSSARHPLRRPRGLRLGRAASSATRRSPWAPRRASSRRSTPSPCSPRPPVGRSRRPARPRGVRCTSRSPSAPSPAGSPNPSGTRRCSPAHERLGARPLVAGQWIRPDHYGDPAAEVRAVREGVGIIDVTPIGKLDLRGPDVPALLNLLYVNKWSELAGRSGALRRDVRRGRRGARRRRHRPARRGPLADVHHLLRRGRGLGVGGELAADRAPRMAGPRHPAHHGATPASTSPAAVPRAARPARPRASTSSDEAFGYMHVRTGRVAGVDDCVLWRIGFTGELSYELHVPAAYGLHVWEALLRAGRDLGVAPFGVEAQRILRLEKGHVIVGQDTDGLTKAYSAGLDRLVKLDKDDFAGKPELVWQHESGRRPAAGRAAAGRRVGGAAGGEPDRRATAGQIVGRITSSRMSPTLGRSVCLAQVDAAHAAPGTEVTVLLPTAGRSPPASRRTSRTSIPRAAACGAVEDAPPGPHHHRAERPVASPRGDPSASRATPTREPGDPHCADAKSARPRWPSGPRQRRTSPTRSVPVRTAPSATSHGDLVVGSGPGEWLVLAAPGTSATLHGRLARARRGHRRVRLGRRSHARTRADAARAARRSADLLARSAPIDLADDAVPDGAALRTSVAELVTDVVRDDAGASRATCCTASARRASTSPTPCSTRAPSSASGRRLASTRRRGGAQGVAWRRLRKAALPWRQRPEVTGMTSAPAT